MLPFEKLIFVRKKMNGSAMMMAYQPFIVCKQKNIPCAVVSHNFIENEIDNIKNSVLILIKVEFSNVTLFKLVLNNNRIIFVPGDSNTSSSIDYIEKNKELLSCIVVSNNLIKCDIKKKVLINVETIVHNFDIFLNSDISFQERNQKLRILFSGAKDYRGIPTNGDLCFEEVKSKNFDLEFAEVYWCPLTGLQNILNGQSHLEFEKFVLECLNNPCKSFLEQINSPLNPAKWSCHYGVRAPWIEDYESYWSNKSATKLITAAGSGANIITSLDPAICQLIDNSYPYSIDTTTQIFKKDYLNICNEMVKKVRETYLSKIWFDGLDILKEVKEKTSCEVVTQQYIDLAVKIF